jgi:hypothetical protein
LWNFSLYTLCNNGSRVRRAGLRWVGKIPITGLDLVARKG